MQINVGLCQMIKSGIFPPVSISAMMGMLCTCAARKGATSHSGYQTLELGLVSGVTLKILFNFFFIFILLMY
jgi:hypothetical protein